MLLTRTPLRMSFAGGGSDLPTFYRRFGGAVVTTTIDKYVYVAVNQNFTPHIHLAYSQTENARSADAIQHPIVRAALQRLGISGGLQIASLADIPPNGTGLGSSSAFTAGLLLALHAYHARHISPLELAHESCAIELDMCGYGIGKQDQYATAVGGLNFIRFDPDDKVLVEPLSCSHADLCKLQTHIVVFYTGNMRPRTSILADQSRAAVTDTRIQKSLSRLATLAYELRSELNNGNVDAMGAVLDEGWSLKRYLHPLISNSTIDDCYAAATRGGARGGKLLGAGGGGFLMFFAPPNRHRDIQNALGHQKLDVAFEACGSQLLACDRQSGGPRARARGNPLLLPAST